MILVLGATGLLGHDICLRLRRAGKPVRALVRSTSNPERRALLGQADVQLHEGDLKSPGSLEAACAGVRTVVSTATASLSRQPGDSIEAVDLRAHLHLVEIAKKAGVAQVIYVSFARLPLEFPLQTAKRAVEHELTQSGLAYTIFQPTLFMNVWLSPMLGFNPAQGQAQIFGSGDEPTSWIASGDVAQFVVGAVDNSRALNRIFPLGGPAALSAKQALAMFESLGAPPAKTGHMAVADLESQFKNTTDPLQRSVAALMLSAARGQVVDSAAAREAIPVKLTSLREYAQEILGRR